MNHEHQNATLRSRTAAFSIDLAVVVAVQLSLGSLTLWFYKFSCTQYGIAADYDCELFLSQFCGAFFFIGYFTISLGLFGNTLGKHLVGIEIRTGHGHKLTLSQAYWRSMAYLMSSWTYMIGFILPWFRKDMMALHDLLCGTRVVQSIQSEAQSGQQLELPLLATVHPIQTVTKEPVPELARTGTDP
jgi:uncharacterized RDD family membrane protein YckC